MMNLIFYIIIGLGWSNIIVDLFNDFEILQLKPFNCKPCLGAWLGLIISMIAFPFGSIEILVIPAAIYFINKLNQDKLL